MTPNEAKWLSMLGVSIGSFIIGILPACYAARGRTVSRTLFLSVLLCFGGGVLLATSVLHMLPETRELLPDYAELVFCSGFLLVYLIDEIVHHFCIREHADPSHEHTDAARRYIPTQNIDRTTQQCSSSSNCLSHNAQNNRGRYQEYSHRQDTYEIGFNAPGRSNSSIHGRDRSLYHETRSALQTNQSNLSNNPVTSKARFTQYGTLSPLATETSCPTENETFLCHGNPAKSCINTNMGHVGLCLALTIHAILEGLAIGLQRHTSEVLLLTASVVAHKFVVGFCLGLELIGSGSKLLNNIFIVGLFSFGSALGIGAGMLARKVEDNWASTLMPVLQGLAGGTLLYVTVSEVLPRERARWHKNEKSYAGIIQFLAVLVGFSIIYFTNSYLAEK